MWTGSHRYRSDPDVGQIHRLPGKETGGVKRLVRPRHAVLQGPRYFTGPNRGARNMGRGGRKTALKPAKLRIAPVTHLKSIDPRRECVHPSAVVERRVREQVSESCTDLKHYVSRISR